MNMKRKRSSEKKAAKKAGPPKISKKIAKLVERSSKEGGERKIVKTTRTFRKAPMSQPAPMPAGPIASPAVHALGVAPTVLAKVLNAHTGHEVPPVGGVQPETRVRDDERVARRAGPDVVPLSNRRFAALWAFQLADAFAAANNPASAPSVAGTTRIVVTTDTNDEIELATFRNPSGLLVVRTRTMESPLDEGLGVKSHLVPHVGKTIDPANVKELRVKNDLYEQRTFDRAALSDGKIIDASTVPPINNAKDGKSAIILGRTPMSREFNRAEVTITEPAGIGPGAKTRVEDDYRFVLHAPTSKLFPHDVPAVELKLEIKISPANDKLALTYRVTRDDSDDMSLLAGANNTTRTKLTNLVPPPSLDGSPPIQAKDVPAVHLLLT